MKIAEASGKIVQKFRRGLSKPRVSIGRSLLATALAIGPMISMAATFSESSLFGFNATDGNQPGGQLIQASDGNYYGSTCEGGASAGSNSGVVWKLTPAGQQSVLHSFSAVTADADSNLLNSDGDCPHGVVQGADGLLYGVTEQGGANGGGVIFKLALNGSGFQVLHNFGSLHSDDPALRQDGIYPQSALIPGSDGNFYGTTLDGGAFDLHGGTLFRISPGGTYEVLHSFSANSNNAGSSIDGSGPIGTLLQGDDGNFYGVTYSGGDRSDHEGGDNGSGGGTAYQFNASSGVLVTLHSFKLFDTSTGDGYEPRTNLAEGADGAFYGATAYGSGSGMDSDNGTLFSVTRTGDFILLHNFTDPNSDGTPPTPLGITLGSDGNFYGTTKFSADGNGGSVFQFAPPPARVFTTLYEFGQPGSSNDGNQPGGPLVQGSDGSLLGTLLGDGPNANSDGGGAVFRLSAAPALAAPVQVKLTPASITLGAAPAQTATLAWKVLNATSQTYSYCFASDAWSGLKGATGSTVVAPTAPGTYRYALTCGGVETGFASLTVLPATPPAPTVTIAIAPGSVRLGSAGTLTWSSTNATSCTASNAWSGSVGTSGTARETPTATGTATYTLNCTGPGGSANRSATLTVTPAPVAPTVTIAVNPSSITLGGMATLAWSSTNANACTASGAWSGSVGTAGSLSEKPTATGNLTFTLTCTGDGGSASNSAALTVRPAQTPPPPPAPTVTIAVNPGSITLGGTAGLSWSSTHATSCVASNAWSGSVGLSGSRSQKPAAAGNLTFTLTCTGDGGGATRSASLTVNAAGGGGGTTGGGTGGGNGGGTNAGGSLDVPVKAGGGAFGLPALLGMLGLAGLRRRRARGLLPALRLGLGLSSIAAGLGAGIAQADSERLSIDNLASHLYAGARLGAMNLDVDPRQLNHQFSAAGYHVNLKESSDAAAGTVYLGYRVYPQIGVELGYTHRDDTVLSLTGTTPANLQGLLDTAVKDVHGYGDIYSASVRVHGEILPRVLLAPRVGAIYWHSETEAQASGLSAARSHSGGGVTIGTSLSYRIWRGLEIGGSVDYFGGNQNNDAALYAGTIEWDFGY